MPALPPDLFQKVVDLLLPFMRNQEERETRLIIVLSTKPVFNSIDWDGAANTFTTRLVHKLSHDELTDVLKNFKKEGEQYASTIESLCDRIYQQQETQRSQVSDRDAAPLASPTGPSFFQLSDPTTSPASRAPIVIALEEQDAPLREDELLRTERHITITFSASQL
jgi:Effector-associated domain 8